MDRPAESATRGEWDEYAESLGLDPEDYSNKDTLIEAVDQAESDLVDTGPEATGERSPQWQKAYDHAISIKGNTPKTAAIFADQTFQSGQFD